MMKKIVLSLFLAGSVLLTSRSAADAACWKTRPCTTADPCVIVTSYFCGTECSYGNWSGAQGCQDSVPGACPKATLVGPGCCTTPCQPPAIGCDPD